MQKHGMPTDPLRRAGAVASDYDALQGLIWLGAGLGLIIIALADTPLYGATLAAAAVPIGQGYYYKRYGRVRQSSSRAWMAAGSAVIAVVVTSAGIIADASLSLPVMLGPLTAAVAMVFFARLSYRHVGVTRIHLAVLGMLAVSVLLPLTGLIASGDYWRADLWLLGPALVVIGVVDHNRLTNAMRPVADA